MTGDFSECVVVFVCGVAAVVVVCGAAAAAVGSSRRLGCGGGWAFSVVVVPGGAFAASRLCWLFAASRLRLRGVCGVAAAAGGVPCGWVFVVGVVGWLLGFVGGVGVGLVCLFAASRPWWVFAASRRFRLRRCARSY